MKKVLFVLMVLFGVYFLATNFPNGTFYYEWDNSSISVQITENYLVFRDPEYSKYISIKDNKNELSYSYWSENYPLNIYKRKNETETFWVIDDYYRGITRSKNGDFEAFMCPDCSGIETTNGENILGFQFKKGTLIKIDTN